MNQLYIYIYPHISSLLRLPPTRPLPLIPLPGIFWNILLPDIPRALLSLRYEYSCHLMEAFSKHSRSITSHIFFFTSTSSIFSLAFITNMTLFIYLFACSLSPPSDVSTKNSTMPGTRQVLYKYLLC